MSLRKKIIICFMLCILSAFIPLIYVLEYRTKPANIAEAEYHTGQLIQSKANEIGSWLNQRISEIRIINEYPYCQALDMERIKPYLSRLNQVLNEDYGNATETFAIGGTDGRGWVNDGITIDVSERSYFKEAMSTDSEYVLSRPVVSKSDYNDIFLICYPIRNGQGERVGFINGAVNLDRITRITRDIDIYGGVSWVMNRKADIYTSLAPFPEDLRSDRLFPANLSTLIGSFDSGALHIPGGTGGDRTLFYASIPCTSDLLLCSLVDDSRICAQTHRIINLLVAICILMLVLSTLFSVLISGSITRPVERLKRLMLQAAGGDLDSHYACRGKGEISVLGNAYNRMLSDIKTLMEQRASIEAQKRRAELRALQSQISPHFLYNTLDTIQWKAIERNAYDIADMIQLLSKLFRISLSSGREYISAEQEMAHVRCYLEIQKIRYAGKLDCGISVDDGASDVLMPKLIVQPIVENAIYHGIKPKNAPGRVDISVGYRDGRLSVRVRDDGVGMGPERLRVVGTDLAGSAESGHYGLRNIDERLALAFGDDYSLRIESSESTGTEVRLEFPGGIAEPGC